MNTIFRLLVVTCLALAGLATGLRADDATPAQPVPSGGNSSVAGGGGTSAQQIGSSSWLDNVSDSTLPVHFGLNLTEVYDDNIYLQPTKTYDYISQISPSVSYILGDRDAAHDNYLNVFYAPTFLIYANNTGQDSIEQNVDVQYCYTFTKLRLGISQQYQKLDDATIDSNNIIHRDVFTTTAIADYDYSDKLSLHSVATQTVTAYGNATQADTNEWNLNTYFLYDVTPKLKVGFGPVIGFMDQQFAPNQTYEQLLAHLQYQATGKMTFALALGAEDREYQHGTSDQVTPVFDLRGDYQATDSTAFFAEGHAETFASASLQGQNYQDVSIQGGVRQRFLQKFFVNLNAGYDNSTYNTLSSAAFNTGRVDNYFFGKTGVSWIPNNWLEVAASYQYSKDNSNYRFASFNDNQYSLRCELKY